MIDLIAALEVYRRQREASPQADCRHYMAWFGPGCVVNTIMAIICDMYPPLQLASAQRPIRCVPGLRVRCKRHIGKKMQVRKSDGQYICPGVTRSRVTSNHRCGLQYESKNRCLDQAKPHSSTKLRNPACPEIAPMLAKYPSSNYSNETSSLVKKNSAGPGRTSSGLSVIR